VRIPFCGDGLQVVWLRYKVLAAAEHHGTDDGVAAVVTPLDRGRAELSYLFWAARAQEGEEEMPDASMLDGEQEWNFYAKYWPSGPGMPVQDLKYAVSLMQALILRHEDASILARIESSFVIHLKLNVPASVVLMLFTSAVAWGKIKAEEPQRLKRPMRCALLVCLFAELKERMTKVVQEPERMEEMAKMGWLAVGSPVVWHFMRWDVAKQQQVVDTSNPPLSQAEILELIGRLIVFLIPRKFATARFHPTRPMTQVMTGQNLVFLLQTGRHGESSAEMRDGLRQICHSSVLHLLAAQLKEDKHARSALANAIADYLTKNAATR
ncbi:unnamed protein product, partial [Symbiodinium sp. KB8]